jgi:SAM-dependent methyltransferase
MMTKRPFYKRTTCCLCGSTELDLAVPLAPVPCGSPNVGDATIAGNASDARQLAVPLDVYLCAACGHLQLLDIVDPSLQYTTYRYTTSISLGLAEHFRTLVSDVMTRLAMPAGGLVVEIGSNDGTVLKLFKQSGMRVLGVDPAVEIARQATAAGVETLGTFFDLALARTIREQHGPANVIVANNVFANLDEPGSLLTGIRQLIAPDGIFVFETQYGVDVFDRMLIDTIYHEHISYFNVAPLQRFFGRHGMELIDVQRIATKGGSLRGVVQLAGGPRQVAPSVEALIGSEAKHGYDQIDRYQSFAQRINDLRSEVEALVAAHRAQNHVVAGYGASVGSVTLIHFFGLSDKLAFIADDHPLHDALSGPGYRIPVVAGDTLESRRPACVVILAWRYADPIIRKHERYLKQGGEFIIPQPTVEVRRA